ncbi:MAG: bifunctional folylpolyglutamate synthase/dihydrofolate synthase [Acidobacteria bacterium]|nr:bifunctional folylpolyglutamate synthase/dihydrofolate synthase [Acidobacteriota bacterium]
MPDAPIARLLALEKLGIKFGLDNIQTLCSALHDPHRAYPTVIVAGTNGKGSVTAMVDAAFGAAGLRAGRYTSPHLIHLAERFVVAGCEVGSDDLAAAAQEVLDLIDRLMGAGALSARPTFFEATTAVAFEIFRRAAVDIAVLEVGLGGRLDATNVASPVAAAITTIALDHERFLGTSLRDIAFEKAGVIKEGMRVVLGDTTPEVVEVIARVCHERGASLILAQDEVDAEIRRMNDDLVVTLRTVRASYGPLTLALRGRHQAQNAVTAVRLLEELAGAGFVIPRAAIEHALAHTVWQGRLDERRLADGRAALFDAAHNPAGAGALAAYLTETGQRLPLVFGVMRDKNAEGMLRALLPKVSAIIATEPRHPRAVAAAELAALARGLAPTLAVEVEPEPTRALERAWHVDPRVLVSGSIFLVGALLAHVEELERTSGDRGRGP